MTLYKHLTGGTNWTSSTYRTFADNWTYQTTIIYSENEYFLEYGVTSKNRPYYYSNRTWIKDPNFVQTVHMVLFYENRDYTLGHFDRTTDLEPASFILYDVTDELNPILIGSTADETIKISYTSGMVRIASRLLNDTHTYDLYYLYNGEQKEIYRYPFRPFMNASGEIISGYTNQISTNDIIASQQQGNKDIQDTIESGNKEIISAIESGNKEIVGSINEILDPTISGDIISNINIIPEISFSGDTFFTMIFNNIYSLFTSGDEVVTLHIPITKTDQAGDISEYYDVPSNFMKVRDTSILRIGLSLMWWWAIGYPFIKWLYTLVFKLNQGSIGEAVDELTTTKGLF